jgi:hypothetical protein
MQCSFPAAADPGEKARRRKMFTYKTPINCNVNIIIALIFFKALLFSCNYIYISANRAKANRK